jgi:hypothetical protein
MKRVTAVLAIAVVLGLGACLFDGSDAAGDDICLTLVAITHGPVFKCPLGLAGILSPVPAGASPLFRLDSPAPPPKA